MLLSVKYVTWVVNKQRCEIKYKSRMAPRTIKGFLLELFFHSDKTLSMSRFIS